MAGHGGFTQQREPSTPDPQLQSKRQYGSDLVEAGWDHHFAHSSMQGRQLITWFLPRGDVMSYLLLWACTFAPDGVLQSCQNEKWSCILFLVRYTYLYECEVQPTWKETPPVLSCSFSRSAFLPHSTQWKHCGFHTISSSDSGGGLKVEISSDMYLLGIGVMIPTAIMKKLVTWKCPHWRLATTVTCIHSSLWQSVLWHFC